MSARAAPLLLCAWTATAAAAPSAAPVDAARTSPPPGLASCAEIGAAADRLDCYDKLAGRAPAPKPPGDGQVGEPASTTRLAPKDAPLTTAAGAAGATAPGADMPSFVSKYWELAPGDKRGVFNFTGYRANYVMPVHLTSDINRSPRSPTQTPIDQANYKRVEGKFQLSLRSKVLQNVGLPGGDLWLTFTQQALWQVWNSAASTPFRNSDYEPEAVYVVPTGAEMRALPFGWNWRYTQLGLVHQSNGQSDPLSRSWNRTYLAAGFERGDWSVVTRINQRLGESRHSDNNPDLVSYRGRADFHVNWNAGVHTASLLVRTTLQDVKYGALQLEWTTPVFHDQPNGLRWYFQAFSGYGETLTDYNFRQNSVGVGVTFLQF